MTGKGESANLDILRAIAVSVVVAHHATQIHGFRTFALGHSGVLLFFVHTSLVLMQSLERSDRGGEAGFGAFMLRRVFRIYPLSMLCVLLCVLSRTPSFLTANTFDSPSIKTVFANLLLVQNFLPGRSISGPLWSLPFEMQMYLALPLLYWLLKRYGRVIWVPLMGWVVMLLVTQTEVQWEIASQFPWDYKILQFVPCFLSGVLAYWLSTRCRPALSAWLWPPVVLSVCFAYSRLPTREASWMLCLLLGISIPFFRESQARVVNLACKTVAKYSYGIYLAHYPLMYWIVRRWHPVNSAVTWTVFAIVLAAVVAACYHLIEKPMIDLGKKLANWRRAVACPPQPAPSI